MILQKQIGNTCLATSVAMVLDLPAIETIASLQHTHAPHFIEFLPLFLRHNKTFTHVDFNAGVAEHSPQDPRPRKVFPSPPTELLQGRNALLFTTTHAVAWDGEHVFDPNGFISDLNKYEILDILLVFDLI